MAEYETKQIADLDSMYVVGEEMIALCAKKLEESGYNTGSMEDNGFRKVLAAVGEFRAAGLTPVILCDEDMKDFCVTTEEKLRRKLH